MNQYITQEARKYLQRSRIPKFVLDQITELCNRVEQLEQENQQLRMREQGKSFQGEYGGQQYQPMGFIYPNRRWWGVPYFRSGEEYTREYNEPQNRRGFDTPYSRPYPDEMRYREGPQYQYTPTREDSEPYTRGQQPRENPKLEPVK